ncbi:MAG: hypothetical protein ACK59G_15330, partial [Cyanobacteriota bacterium]
HRLGAEAGGRLVGGGEIGHVGDRVAGGAYGPLSSVHIRVAGPWMLPQLRCVGEYHAPGAGFGYMLVSSILAQLDGVFPVLARPLLASRLLAGLSAFLARLPAGGIGGAHAGDGGLARGLECWGPG